jgi:hypothetical protein
LRQRIERRLAAWGLITTHQGTETDAHSWTGFDFQLRLSSTSSDQESRLWILIYYKQQFLEAKMPSNSRSSKICIRKAWLYQIYIHFTMILLITILLVLLNTETMTIQLPTGP